LKPENRIDMLDMPPPPAAARSLGDIIAEIESRIAATAVRTRPFPHLVVDDLLPAPLRRMLDAHWPSPDRFGTTNYFRRGEVSVSHLARLAEDQEELFWNALRRLTMRLARAARARLDRHLGEKFRPLLGPDWRRRLGTPVYLDNDAMLAHYTGVVDLVPHIDNARLTVNGFVYLDDPSLPTPEPRRGTMLYRSIGFAWPSNITIPKPLRDRFLREATEVEWRDNRLLAYVNGPTSFHGVPKHDLGDARRRLLMFGSLLDKEAARKLLDSALWQVSPAAKPDGGVPAAASGATPGPSGS